MELNVIKYEEPCTSQPQLTQENAAAASHREPAICVRGAQKQYGSKNIILNGLNMTVPRGSIYGLLGASGCGKTTLLSCIMGRRRLNTGDVWVLGGRPGTRASGVPGPRIGYMPQELALYLEFTIYETLIYFGWIAGLSADLIEQRIDFLIALLHLPNTSRYVRQLSGGQQRRTSLAAALLHDPELLILDEPTAGVDPILRQDVWEHLLRIASTGNRTIIITTHYIEEARQANVVGLMRGGIILAEESPVTLMKKLRCDSLEDAFLKLSYHQNNDELLASTQIEYDDLDPIDVSKDSCTSLTFREHLTIVKAHHLQALIRKNFLWMLRSVAMLAFMVGLPCLQIVLFYLAIGRDPTNLRLCVVNHELPAHSTECDAPLLSCRYLSLLNSKIFQYEFCGSEDECHKEVREGRAWGSMALKNGFSESKSPQTHDIPMTVWQDSNVVLYLDKSNYPINTIMRRAVQFAYTDLTDEILTSHKMNPKHAHAPLHIETPIYGDPIESSKFSDSAAPGALLTIIFFQSVILASSAMLNERHKGMLDRFFVSGVTATEVLLSNMATQIVVISCESMLVLAFGYAVFDLPLICPVIWVVCLTMLTGVMGMCFGFAVASACDNERTATLLAMGSFMPNFLSCGVLWPIEGMHPVLRTVAQYLPLSRGAESMRSIMLRGLSIHERDVYVGFVSVGIWALVFMCVCVLCLKLKKA